MRVMHRADNTDAKNLVIMAVQDISIYFENNVGVVVKGDEGFGDHKNSKSRKSRMRQKAVLNTTDQLQVTIEYVQRADGSVETMKIHTVVSSIQRT